MLFKTFFTLLFNVTNNWMYQYLGVIHYPLTSLLSKIPKDFFSHKMCLRFWLMQTMETHQVISIDFFMSLLICWWHFTESLKAHMKLCIKAALSYSFHIITDLNVSITRPGKAPQACNYLNYLKPDYTLAQYFSRLSFLKLKLWCWR